MSSPTLPQKLTAEALGTAILVFIGAGSVPLTPPADRQEPVRQRRAYSTISFAFAFAIFAAVYAVGHISGAHINPAVTIALAATRKIDGPTAAVLHRRAGHRRPHRRGPDLYHPGRQRPGDPGPRLGRLERRHRRVGGVAAEAIGTAILVFTVFGAAVDGRAPAGFAGIVIGFIVYGIIILVGPITGAALNPARQVGPVLVEALIGFGKTSDRFGQLWVYIVGPLAGGLIGAFLYEFVGRRQPETETAPAAPPRQVRRRSVVTVTPTIEKGSSND